MPKRKIVYVNIPAFESILRANGWSNDFFTVEKLKKGRGLITEWKRGKNFPSPEEAAKMCELLHTTPREILLKEEDIALVEGLLAERDPGIKNPPAEAGGEMSTARERALFLIKNTGDEKIESLLALLELMQRMDGKMLDKLVAFIETTVGDK